jgi:endoglucanase
MRTPLFVPTVVSVLAAAAGLSWMAAGPAASAADLTVQPAAAGAGGFYVDPTAQVQKWVAANPNDPRMPVIRDRIAAVPQAHWVSKVDVSTVQAEVSDYVSGAGSAVPVLVAYGITNRDCGGASAGGAANLSVYGTWIANFARGIGSSAAVVILEPDSLALQTCLSASDITARDNALASAVQAFRGNAPNAKVYLDAGHSAWNSASDQASRLRNAGVANSAGIFTNVSNFNPTSDESSFAAAVLSAIGNPALHAVIDTSRNGNGSNGQWCDPAGRAIGQSPARPVSSTVDAYLWVKPPGEADGCAAAAGTFSPDLAYALATNGNPPPTSTPPPTTTRPPTTPPPTTPPPTTPPTSAPPTSTPPAGGGTCAFTYHVDNDWGTGFTATVTIRNDGPAVTGWTTSFRFAGTQHVTNAWNGTLTSAGPTVSVTNVSSNATIPTGTSVNFGFQATYTGTNAAPTTATFNGTTC